LAPTWVVVTQIGLVRVTSTSKLPICTSIVLCYPKGKQCPNHCGE